MRIFRKLLLGVLLSVWLGAGCGHSLSYTVEPELLQRLPKKSRRSVFQARTVVTIAIDRLSSIRRQIDGTRRDIDRIKERVDKIEKELGNAGPRESQRLRGEIDVLDARQEYLEHKIEFLEEKLDVAEDELLLAKGQFELAKVRLVKKHSIAFDGDEADFVEQVEDLQQKVNERRKDLERDEAELKRQEQKWLAVKKRFYSSIGESSKGWWTE